MDGSTANLANVVASFERDSDIETIHLRAEPHSDRSPTTLAFPFPPSRLSAREVDLVLPDRIPSFRLA